MNFYWYYSFVWKEETAGELIDKSAMYGIQIISYDII